MQRVDEFLRAVEVRLRCPADRRPGVMEELRGHLADRAEALVREGLEESEAERRAVRELGPAWLLALRLSAANGWSALAHVLRELWAAGVGFEVAVVCGLLMLVLPEFGQPPEAIPVVQWAYIAPTGAAALAALCVFAFAMGRVVRGWLWAMVPTLVLLQMASLQYHGGHVSTRDSVGVILCLSSAPLFVAASVQGQRRQTPKLAWLAWAAAGVIAAYVVALGAIVMLWQGDATTGGVPVPLARGFLLVLRELANAYEVPAGLTLMAVSWFFWLGAWVIERVGREPRKEVAE